MPAPTLSREILIAALAGFQLDKQRVDAKIAEVQAMLDGSRSPSVTATPEAEPKKGRRKRSAAVRKRMAEAQKARWARVKGESESKAPRQVATKKVAQQTARKNTASKKAAVKKRAAKPLQIAEGSE